MAFRSVSKMIIDTGCYPFRAISKAVDILPEEKSILMQVKSTGDTSLVDVYRLNHNGPQQLHKARQHYNTESSTNDTLCEVWDPNDGKKSLALHIPSWTTYAWNSIPEDFPPVQNIDHKILKFGADKEATVTRYDDYIEYKPPAGRTRQMQLSEKPLKGLHCDTREPYGTSRSDDTFYIVSWTVEEVFVHRARQEDMVPSMVAKIAIPVDIVTVHGHILDIRRRYKDAVYRTRSGEILNKSFNDMLSRCREFRHLGSGFYVMHIEKKLIIVKEGVVLHEHDVSDGVWTTCGPLLVYLTRKKIHVAQCVDKEFASIDRSITTNNPVTEEDFIVNLSGDGSQGALSFCFFGKDYENRVLGMQIVKVSQVSDMLDTAQ